MLKVCRFNLIRASGGGGGGTKGGKGGAGGIPTSPLRFFVIKCKRYFSKNLAFNFYGQLKHDRQSLSHVSRCFVERR